MSEKDIQEWWDEASEYYQMEINGDDLKTVHYGPFGSDERKLKLLGEVKNKKVLELGCGGGQCSVTLAKQGARCIGIDISEKQLKHAAKLAAKNGVKVNFIKKSFSDLGKFKKSSFDIVISIFALQYSENLGRVLKDAYRVLRERGTLIFSIDHPFYMAIDPNTMKITDNYNKSGKFEEKERWPDGRTRSFTMYRYRISDIINAIVGSGLKLVKVTEPFDKKDKVWGQGYRIKLVNKITPTIIFKCQKI